jgi:hypothetical protein
MAENLADEVIQASTDFDGRERAPMRLAEARITLGVIRAREGDLEGDAELPRPDHRAHRRSCHDLGVGQAAARVRALPSIGCRRSM